MELKEKKREELKKDKNMCEMSNIFYTFLID